MNCMSHTVISELLYWPYACCFCDCVSETKHNLNLFLDLLLNQCIFRMNESLFMHCTHKVQCSRSFNSGFLLSCLTTIYTTLNAVVGLKQNMCVASYLNY